MRSAAHLIAVVVSAASLACGSNSSPAGKSGAQPAAAQPAPAPKVTQATFEPVYRSAKAVEGATATGVTYQKFGELLQSLSTEISIAKDHPLTDVDKRLLALYEEALHHYQVSGTLWELKLHASGDTFHGEIPIGRTGALEPSIAEVVRVYALPVNERKLTFAKSKYKAIPGDSPQRVWAAASATLKKATDLYYGR